MTHKLILNRNGEEQVHEFADICEAFDAAEHWLMEGYIARITDQHGVVKYTQSLSGGQMATYPGDDTDQVADSGAPPKGQSPTGGPTKPWWQFW